MRAVLATCKCLGHHIDSDAGIRSCFLHTSAAMWRAFFGNLSTGLLQASDRAKFRFLQASVKSVAAFRWARWPFQQSYAAKLDRTQRKMIGHLLQIRPQPDESVDEFVQRRHSITSRKARHMGFWSLPWAGSCVSLECARDQTAR